MRIEINAHITLPTIMANVLSEVFDLDVVGNKIEIGASDYEVLETIVTEWVMSRMSGGAPSGGAVKQTASKKKRNKRKPQSNAGQQRNEQSFHESIPDDKFNSGVGRDSYRLQQEQRQQLQDSFSAPSENRVVQEHSQPSTDQVQAIQAALLQQVLQNLPVNGMLNQSSGITQVGSGAGMQQGNQGQALQSQAVQQNSFEQQFNTAQSVGAPPAPGNSIDSANEFSGRSESVHEVPTEKAQLSRSAKLGKLSRVLK